MLWTYMIIFVLAATPFFEIIAIIPIAIVGGLPTIPVLFLSFFGNLLTIVILIKFVDLFRKWLLKNKDLKNHESKRYSRARSIWNNFGLPGLLFLGPIIVGSHLSALLSIAFGGSKQKTLYLMSISLFLWTLILGIGSHYGFSLFVKDDNNQGFIMKIIKGS
ncbi:small multi-drug export protein [Lederbergia lenta]|uniref:Putative small multidrug efflux protein n=1 Tax=Lederbergia lenta TaxID=1467 RepID=A0A2X4VLF0_LEDLE|nr:small multi-drug export protein [Lederbergia lenta]MCM3112429.1 small multi-drug export protein [Lederbergia lenta]MEC2323463.1 small multi-drug export protein [Lederbergia lenta]SQI52976.1 putative small multidrug efflux protein [Lederbergia lenta]